MTAAGPRSVPYPATTANPTLRATRSRLMVSSAALCSTSIPTLRFTCTTRCWATRSSSTIRAGRRTRTCICIIWVDRRTFWANFRHRSCRLSRARVPAGVTTQANAHVTNGAGYAQEMLSLLQGRILIGGGLRYDEFRYAIQDGCPLLRSQIAALAAGNRLTPFHRSALTQLWAGINSADARAVVEPIGLATRFLPAEFRLTWDGCR